MGIYGDQVFPRIMNLVMDTRETRQIRQRLCAPLRGAVVEIGFGTGHNLPFMPGAVTRLLAVEPLTKARDLAAPRVAAARFPVEFVGLDGQRLPLGDGSADAVLSTWTLCSIDDPVAAVREIGRILRPGGTLHFVEHGLAAGERVQKWQDRCNGLQRRMACGCNLNRDVPALMTEGGLSIQGIDAYYAKGRPKALGWTFEGWATSGSTAVGPA
ncbi:MAG: class I SAM-dependent methyltransferase [Actinomycetota bacterium]|nr:class I SAM-dependent methyltransferase [Actinomycetota bacterium]MDQ3641007.1 class I SAM-dependent methyltransferase [Actinomycetota bacterium]